MKQLVLFDIDGTLIQNTRSTDTINRFPYALNKVFGIDVHVSEVGWKYNGVIDRAILWDLAKKYEITKKDFDGNFPELIIKFQEYFDTLKVNKPAYIAIKDAITLVETLITKGIHIGVLTGNLYPSAMWKMSQVGIDNHFDFGLYGHEAEDRIALAKLVFSKAQKYFGHTFASEDIVIIGDTTHDIICGKAIGAVTIAVMTGWKPDKARLLAQKPDLLVDSLMDRSVRDFFGV